MLTLPRFKEVLVEARLGLDATDINEVAKRFGQKDTVKLQMFIDFVRVSYLCAQRGNREPR